MEATEFERVPDTQGHYISSNAPPSGVFVPFNKDQIIVDRAALFNLLTAVCGTEHYIRELQYTRGVEKLNPINVLISAFDD